MFGLVIAILFGLGITFFAFQNAAVASINFVNYRFIDVPVYLIVVISVLAGIIMAWFISAINSLSYFSRIHGKDNIIQNDKKEIKNLEAKIRNLELENAKLRHKDQVVVEKSQDRTQTVQYEEDAYKPSLIERIFPNSSRRYSKQI